MKEVFHKISAVLMAIVVMFSTMSFTVDMHYCGDTLVDMAVLTKAESCGMEMESRSTSEDCSVKKKNCCSDEQLMIEGQQDIKTSKVQKLSDREQLFVASYLYTYKNLFEELHDKVIPNKDYLPPVVVRDIQLLDEVFLI